MNLWEGWVLYLAGYSEQGYLDSLPTGNSCWLTREAKGYREGTQGCTSYERPREWFVLPGGWSFTSFSSLNYSRMCFRVPPRVKEDQEFENYSKIMRSGGSMRAMTSTTIMN